MRNEEVLQTPKQFGFQVLEKAPHAECLSIGDFQK